MTKLTIMPTLTSISIRATLVCRRSFVIIRVFTKLKTVLSVFIDMAPTSEKSNDVIVLFSLVTRNRVRKCLRFSNCLSGGFSMHSMHTPKVRRN